MDNVSGIFGETVQQYRVLLSTLTLLLEEGFVPVPTAPVDHASPRDDHTRAILELLASYDRSSLPSPLKVFSTGPVYEVKTARWTESVDVEILGADTLTCDAMVLGLMSRLFDAIAPSESVRMVLGHVGWLFESLSHEGVGELEIHAIRQCLMKGNLADAERIMKTRAPKTHKACRVLRDASLLDMLRDLEIPGPETLANTLSAIPMGSIERLWDLSMTGVKPYYTGLVFSAYRPGAGRAALTGGRFCLEVDGTIWEGVGFTMQLATGYPEAMPVADMDVMS